MRYGPGIGQNGAQAEIQSRLPAQAGASVKEIPYDYVATFKLEGRFGRRVQDVIAISTEGTFVATSIGYSFIPARPSDPGAVLPAIQRPGIDFKYSIVDSGSGRELQNQAIHNIAGLGSANGERPFRPFARPALFLPRSTIRIEVEEISEGQPYRDAQLFIVLHGYKRLGE